MALKKTVTKFSVDFTEAYHRVEAMNVTKEVASAQVAIYPNATAALDRENEMGITTYSFAYDPNGQETLTQAYNFLKTLPEYEGAIDV